MVVSRAVVENLAVAMTWAVMNWVVTWGVATAMVAHVAMVAAV